MPGASSTELPAVLAPAAPPTAPTVGLAAEIGRRLAAEIRLKLLLAAAMWVGFAVPYFLLQHFPVFPVRSFPLTAVDRWVGFEHGWVYVYQSAYLLIPVAPWLADTRRRLRVYAEGFLWLCAAGFLVCLLLPVEGPRPENPPTGGMYGLVLLYDGKLNAFPSLHVALTAQSLMFGLWMCRDTFVRVPSAVRAALWAGVAWGLAVGYSTLATKQHYAVDVPAGILLAWCGHQIAVARAGGWPGTRCAWRCRSA